MTTSDFQQLEKALVARFGNNAFRWPMADPDVIAWAQNQESVDGYESEAAHEVLIGNRESAPYFDAVEQ